MTSSRRNLSSISLLLTLLAGCGDDTGTQNSLKLSDTACSATTAQLAFRDGYLQLLCGCAEPTSDIVPPATLTCTVSAGTTVFFHLENGNVLHHQVASTGTPSFPSSPVGTTTNPTHAYRFDTVGTYQFVDRFDERLSGVLVVQ